MPDTIPETVAPDTRILDSRLAAQEWEWIVGLDVERIKVES